MLHQSLQLQAESETSFEEDVGRSRACDLRLTNGDEFRVVTSKFVVNELRAYCGFKLALPTLRRLLETFQEAVIAIQRETLTYELPDDNPVRHFLPFSTVNSKPFRDIIASRVSIVVAVTVKRLLHDYLI